MSLPIPPDAICAHEFCKHPYSSHTAYVNCGVCGDCNHPVTAKSPGLNFHDFKPMRLAGGAVSPQQEQEIYLRALRGES